MSAYTPGTNFYFDQFNNQGEQDLWEDLIIESIQIYGQDMFYLPRTLNTYDELYGEDATSSYDSAIPIELYIKSYDGFQGEGTIFAKFGVEIRDQVTFTVAKRIWEEQVGSRTNNGRPNEGDLIYYPMNRTLFQVKYVDKKPFFFQHGAIHTWYDLKCELYEYSNERINTGVYEIDELQLKYSSDIFDYAILGENGEMLADENGNIIVSQNYSTGGSLDEDIQAGTDTAGDSVADNEEIQDEQEGSPDITADDILNWTEIDPFSQGGRYAKDTLFLNSRLDDRPLLKGRNNRPWPRRALTSCA